MTLTCSLCGQEHPTVSCLYEAYQLPQVVTLISMFRFVKQDCITNWAHLTLNSLHNTLIPIVCVDLNVYPQCVTEYIQIILLHSPMGSVYACTYSSCYSCRTDRTRKPVMSFRLIAMLFNRKVSAWLGCCIAIIGKLH